MPKKPHLYQKKHALFKREIIAITFEAKDKIKDTSEKTKKDNVPLLNETPQEETIKEKWRLKTSKHPHRHNGGNCLTGKNHTATSRNE